MSSTGSEMPRLAIESQIPISSWFSELATPDVVRRAMRDLKERCVLVIPQARFQEYLAHLRSSEMSPAQKNVGRLIQAGLDECIRVEYLDKRKIEFSIVEARVGFDAIVETLWSEQFHRAYSQRVKQPFLQKQVVGGMPTYESPAEACERIFGDISVLISRIEILDAWAGSKFVDAVAGVPNGLDTFLRVALKDYKGELSIHTRVGGKRDPASEVMKSELSSIEKAIGEFRKSKGTGATKVVIHCYADLHEHRFSFPHDRMMRIEFRGGKSAVFAMGHGTELFSNKRNEPNVKLFSELHEGSQSWKVAMLCLSGKKIEDF